MTDIDLHEYPHVQARVTELWGTAEGLMYLRSLLVPKDRTRIQIEDLEYVNEERRTGAGFPLAFLHKVLRLIEVHPPFPLPTHAKLHSLSPEHQHGESGSPASEGSMAEFLRCFG